MLAAATALLLLTMPPAPTADASYRAEIETWRAARAARLQAPDGWLSVIGLYWLEPGPNAVGSSPDSRVRLPGVPPKLASIALPPAGAAGTATLTPADAEGLTADGKPVSGPIALSTDADAQPTMLARGTLLFYLIQRGDRVGVRVKDSASEARRSFHGIPSFPIDPAWRIEARFEPYDPPKSISVPNVLGQQDPEPSPGALVFERDGKTYRLDPVLERGETDYFVIFGDRTNGTDTYGAGRFLYVAPPVGGKTVIDFNKAYNPPCVFTEYATCPLPPPQNKLPIRIEAGEKEYAP